MKKGTENSWEIDGDCKVCRRNEHCTKACTLNKRRTKNILHNAVRNTFPGEVLSVVENQLKGGCYNA